MWNWSQNTAGIQGHKANVMVLSVWLGHIPQVYLNIIEFAELAGLVSPNYMDVFLVFINLSLYNL